MWWIMMTAAVVMMTSSIIGVDNDNDVDDIETFRIKIRD